MPSPSPDLPGAPAALVPLLLAVDPHGLGGAVLDHPLHEGARAFGTLVQALLPSGAPLRRLPAGVTADRLYGGVDLAASLAAGRLVAERGVLALADGGVVVVPMAERLPPAARTALTEVLDQGTIRLARDGVAAEHAARVCLVLLDESVEDEAVPSALGDRLAFRLPRSGGEAEPAPDTVAAWARLVREARHRLARQTVDDRWIAALCATADAFGIDGVRAPLLALRCARAHAALHGRLLVAEADAEAAAALVLAPRATRLPMPPAEPPPPAADEAPPPPPTGEDAPPDPPEEAETPQPPGLGELLRDAVAAAIPPGVLAQLLAQLPAGRAAGRVGDEVVSLLRGRPRGARTGLPRGGARLHLLETLRAAAPWQRARGAAVPNPAPRITPTRGAGGRPRVAIRRGDFRVRRFVERTGTTVLFVVDASGSSALQRLGEAKGAIEVLLAESYARRDRVSLMAFRGQGTEVLLPPTRALARARKVLAALPGGGGTPLAHAIDAALEQALAIRRGGSAAMVVLLTDGRANIARDGAPGRAAAEADALAAGRRFAQAGVGALFVDTSPRGEAVARRVAEAMRARYILLPAADARALGGLVRAALQVGDGG
ncbi:MAG: magnesium chelatase subunit D [Gemmatimonadetes bacterium]|nr:magnesium chelatase subunit D [Gemmatimonadota bacterium]